MTVYSGDLDAIEQLRASLRHRAGDIADRAAAVPWLMVDHGHEPDAAQVRHHLVEVEGWLRCWEWALGHRTGVLAGIGAVVAGQPQRCGRPVTPPGPHNVSHLIDALQRGDLDGTARLLDSLVGASPAQAAAFLTAFGADMVALLPLVVFEQGVPAADLGRYIGPLAGVLAAALPTGRTGFGLEEVMHDAARSEVGPGIYFSFAPFADADLVEATTLLMGQFHRAEIPLRTPAVVLPGGATAQPDPRLDLLAALMGRDAVTRVALVTAVVDASGAGAVVAPATPWGDGGAAIAALLASVAGALDRTTVLVVATSATAPRVSPVVRLAAWRLLWASILSGAP